MTKDKKYIENLFRNYKSNIARKKVIELGLVTDDDYTLGAIDYSSDNIQTSNISSLDNRIIAREKELEKLTYEIQLAEILLDRLNEKDKLLIDSFYIKEMKAHQVATLLDYYSIGGFWYAHGKIMEDLYALL